MFKSLIVTNSDFPAYTQKVKQHELSFNIIQLYTAVLKLKVYILS